MKKHLILRKKDLDNYLNREDINFLYHIFNKIEESRKKDKKKKLSHIVFEY